MIDRAEPLTPKPGCRIVFPHERPLCPVHGCFMRVRDTAPPVTYFFCPVDDCECITKKVLRSQETELPAREADCND